MKKRVVLCIGLLFVLLWQTVSAQESMILTTESEVDTSNFPDISFDVTPINNTGVPVNGLDATRFSIREDGQPVENLRVEQFPDADENISIMLVLDVSGSLEDNLEELHTAATVLFDGLNILPNEDEAGLITFSLLEDGTTVDLSDPFPQLNPERESDFTGDGGLLANLLSGLTIEPNAGTPLYDAMFKGVRLTSNARNARRAVIVMTDGVDSDRDGNRDAGSQVADAEIVIEQAQRAGVPIFTVGLGDDDDIDVPFLQRAATLTGGTYQQTADPEELGALFSLVSEELKQKYRVTYTSQVDFDDRLHDISITVDGPDGDATMSTEFRAPLPEVPVITNVLVTLPEQEEAVDLSSLETLVGVVTLRPEIVLRGTITQVNYFVDDGEEPVATVDASPYEYEWDTRGLNAADPHTLRIQVLTDDPNVAAGEASFQIMLEQCDAICNLRIGLTQFGLTPLSLLLILLGLLLILLVAMFVSRNRRKKSTVRPKTYGGGGAPIPPTGPAPPPTNVGIPPSGFPGGVHAPPPVSGTLPTEVLPGGGQSGIPTPPVTPAGPAPGAGSPAKTVVLSRKPSKRASLIHVGTGANHSLDRETTIGRVASNDIRLEDDAVSSNHSVVKLENGHFVFYDLAPTNPSELNGKRVTTPRRLKDNDRLKIGGQTLVFKALPDA